MKYLSFLIVMFISVNIFSIIAIEESALAQEINTSHGNIQAGTNYTYDKLKINTSYGKIEFLDVVKSKKDITELSKSVSITKGSIFVKDYDLKDIRSNVTFYDLFTEPQGAIVLLHNSILCKECTISNIASGWWSFIVDHFSTWTVIETQFNGTFVNTTVINGNLTSEPFAILRLTFNYNHTTTYPFNVTDYSIPNKTVNASNATQWGADFGIQSSGAYRFIENDTSNRHVLEVRYTDDLLMNSSGSVSLFVNFTSLRPETHQVAISSHPLGGYINGWLLSQNSDDLFGYVGSTLGGTTITCVDQLDTLRFRHIVLQWNLTDNEIWLDGNRCGITPRDSAPMASNRVTWIGGNNELDSTLSPNATIDEVSFYDRMLTSQEILNINRTNPMNIWITTGNKTSHFYNGTIVNSTAYLPRTTFNYSNSSDFSRGNFSTTNYQLPFVILNGSSVFGNFTSEIFDALSFVRFTNLSWVQELCYYCELPNNRTTEMQFMNNTNMSEALVLYHFNNEPSVGESEITVFDFSYRGNTGTANHSNFTRSITKFGNATFSINVSSSVIINDSDYFSPNISRNMSIEFWYRYQGSYDFYFQDDTSCQTAYGVPFVVKGNSTPAREFMVEIKNMSSICFGLWGQGEASFTTSVASCESNKFTVNDSRWHHIGWVINYNSTMEGWIDGNRVCTNSTFVGLSNITNTDVFVAGSPSILMSLGSSTANISMDEFAIYNRSLSAQEIQMRYRKGILRLNASVRYCANANCSDTTFTSSDLTDPRGISLDLNQRRFINTRFNFFTENSTFSPKLYNFSFHAQPLSNIVVWQQVNLTANSKGNNISVQFRAGNSSNISSSPIIMASKNNDNDTFSFSTTGDVGQPIFNLSTDSLGNITDTIKNYSIQSYREFAPFVDQVQISPSSPTVTDAINVSTRFIIADTDSGNVTFYWYIDGILSYNSTVTNVTNGQIVSVLLNSGNLSSEDLINVTVFGTGIYAIGDNASSSTIQVQFFSVPIIGGGGGGGGGSSSNNAIETGNETIIETTISCFNYNNNLNFVSRKGEKIKKDLQFRNNCNTTITLDFICKGDACENLIFNNTQTFLNNTVSNFTIFSFIPLNFNNSILTGDIFFDNIANSISIKIHISSSLFENLMNYLKETSFIEGLSRIWIIIMIYAFSILFIYLLLFKLISPLIAISLSFIVPLLIISIYIISKVIQ